MELRQILSQIQKEFEESKIKTVSVIPTNLSQYMLIIAYLDGTVKHYYVSPSQTGLVAKTIYKLIQSNISKIKSFLSQFKKYEAIEEWEYEDSRSFFDNGELVFPANTVHIYTVDYDYMIPIYRTITKIFKDKLRDGFVVYQPVLYKNIWVPVQQIK